MQGDRLRKIVFSSMAMLLVLYITIFGAGSWSQNALTALGVLLNPALIFMGYVFIMNADSNPGKDRLYFRVPIIQTKVRMKHLSMYTAWMFWMIVAFPVTQGLIDNSDAVLSPEIVEFLHLLFTGLAIFGVVLEMYYYHRRWSRRFWINNGAIIIAVIYFLSTFLLELHTVAMGELAIAFVGFAHLLSTNKKLK